MSGTLFVVATPIGNLEDITFRAVRVLREADLIAAEDTRRTGKLLAHFAISTRTVSFHDHNRRSRIPQVVARIEGGEKVALVSDAGTPGLSDPGVDLVKTCLERGLRVEPVPGPSAALAAATASGFPLEPLTVFGFPPVRGQARKNWFEKVRGTSHTVSFFEAPHRIRQTLHDLAGVSGKRPICVARELTKIHEQVVVGTATDIIGQITDWRGEFTIVVGPALVKNEDVNLVSDLEIARAYSNASRTSGGRRRLVADLAKKYGRSPNDVYGIIEKFKDSPV